MKTVLTVLGTRPEAIKMCPLVRELRRREGVKAVVAVSGQHREMLDEVLSVFGVTPDYDLELMKAGQGLAELTSGVLSGISALLSDVHPDLVLVHGDTATAFAASLAAFYQKISVAHIEAGLRTSDIRSPFPEEFNRRAISLMARYHFAPTDWARDNLLAEGKAAADIFVTGNTVIDALRMTVREDFCHPLLDWASGSRLIIVTAHRRENLGEPMRRSFARIRRIVEAYPDVKVIFPLHKNPEARQVARSAFEGCERVRLVEPLDVVTFHNLLARAYTVLSDSGGIQEEATALGKPLLVMRDTTERPEGIASGTLRLVGTDGVMLESVCRALLDDASLYASMAKASDLYGDGQASKRIADILVK